MPANAADLAYDLKAPLKLAYAFVPWADHGNALTTELALCWLTILAWSSPEGCKIPMEVEADLGNNPQQVAAAGYHPQQFIDHTNDYYIDWQGI